MTFWWEVIDLGEGVIQRGEIVVGRAEDDIMIVLRANVSVHDFIHMA